MMAKTGSRSVFVGNIPYDATEEQLMDLFREVGTVVNFRLVFDKDTGKAKGFGFCEFSDAATAASAIRNLNGREFHNRTLRVDSADDKGEGFYMTGGVTGAGSGPSNPVPGPGAPVGQGAPAASPMSSMQSDISKLLDAMSPAQLYEIMVQLKGLTQTNPEQVRKLLSAYPQFTYAILQAQVVLGMVPANIAQQLNQPPPAPMQPKPAPPPPQQQFNAPSVPQQFPFPNMGMQLNQLNNFGPGMTLPPHLMQPGLGAPLPMMPSVQSHAPPVLPNDQKALLDQVMMLTPEQINQIPPTERAQILELRKAMMGMRR